MRATTWLLILVFSALSVPALAKERTITVKGFAEQRVAPDILRLTFTVSRQALQQLAAKQEVDTLSSAAVRAALAEGIAEADIDSSQLRITPRSRWENNRQIDDGYEVERTVTVILRDLTRYNSLVDALVAAGIDTLRNVQPDLASQTAIKNQALRAAIADARNKATLIAGEFNGKLGKPLAIAEQQVSNQFPLRMVAMADSRSGKENYDFQPGLIEVSAEVTVEFQLDL